MPTTTAINSLPIPLGSEVANGPAQISALATAVDPKLVGVFADAAARDVKIPSPTNGMLVWLDSPGAYARRVAGTWKLDYGIAPMIEGTLSRTDGALTINGSAGSPSGSFTDFRTNTTSSRTTWTTFTAADGVGVQNAAPGRYEVNALVLTDLAAARGEQLVINGTRSGTLGFTSVATNGFGGAGGTLAFDCPTGIQIYFRFLNSSTTSGVIRESRFSVEWKRPI